jgi:hypothetical protein
VVCPLGHEWKTNYNNFTQGTRCGSCDPRLPFTVEFVRNDLKVHGYELLSGDYLNSYTNIEARCPKGHVRPLNYSNFRRGFRCGGCANQASKAELEIFTLVHDRIQSAVSGSRSVLRGREVDVWCPEQKVAIEYNGLYWHSEAGGKTAQYHLSKTNLAVEAGVRLFQFFEDEWRDKRPIVESLIFRALRLNKGIVIGARKLLAKRISDVKSRADFFNSNHLQGDRAAAVAWGLYDGETLVQALSIRKNSITGGEPFYDIARLATRLGYSVPGGLSRLIALAKQWVASKGESYLYTYSDLRYSQGDAYLKVGFESLGATSPGYFYTNGEVRVHRYNLKKTDECPEGTTNDSWRRSQGWYRLWDCGQLKFRIKTGA